MDSIRTERSEKVDEKTREIYADHEKDIQGTVNRYYHGEINAQEHIKERAAIYYYYK